MVMVMVGGGEQLWPGQLADNLMALRPNIGNTHQGIIQAFYWVLVLVCIHIIQKNSSTFI